MAVLNIFRASCLARSSIAARASYMIRSAVDFLPRIIMMFTNFATRREPYLGAGSTSRLAAPARRMDYAPPALGALAPYLERRCFRPAPPAGPRGPRMMRYRLPVGAFTRPPR